MMAALTLFAPLVGAAAKKSTSGNPTLLIIVVIGAAFYFLIYRPQQRKAKAAKAQTNAFDVGDEVLTAGGIGGHIIDIDGDRVTLETSVGASFVVLRPYVLRRLEAPVEDESEEGDGDGEDDDEGDSAHDQSELTGGADDHDDAELGDQTGVDPDSDDTSHPDGPTAG